MNKDKRFYITAICLFKQILNTKNTQIIHIQISLALFQILNEDRKW